MAKVVPLLGHYVDGRELCLVMPLFETACARGAGEPPTAIVRTLRDLLTLTQGPLDELTALRVAHTLFNGLKGLHTRRILHRVRILSGTFDS